MAVISKLRRFWSGSIVAIDEVAVELEGACEDTAWAGLSAQVFGADGLLWRGCGGWRLSRWG